jgi:hypothetical protein
LCRGHHRELHRRGDKAAWWKKNGVDPMLRARVLWLETRPLPIITEKPGIKDRNSVAARWRQEKRKPRSADRVAGSE